MNALGMRAMLREPQHEPYVHEVRHGVSQVVDVVVRVRQHGLVHHVVAAQPSRVHRRLVELSYQQGYISGCR